MRDLLSTVRGKAYMQKQLIATFSTLCTTYPSKDDHAMNKSSSKILSLVIGPCIS
jgi:hypothetical protein